MNLHMNILAIFCSYLSHFKKDFDGVKSIVGLLSKYILLPASLPTSEPPASLPAMPCLTTALILF